MSYNQNRLFESNTSKKRHHRKRRSKSDISKSGISINSPLRKNIKFNIKKADIVTGIHVVVENVGESIRGRGFLKNEVLRGLRIDIDEENNKINLDFVYTKNGSTEKEYEFLSIDCTYRKRKETEIYNIDKNDEKDNTVENIENSHNSENDEYRQYSFMK